MENSTSLFVFGQPVGGLTYEEANPCKSGIFDVFLYGLVNLMYFWMEDDRYLVYSVCVQHC